MNFSLMTEQEFTCSCVVVNAIIFYMRSPPQEAVLTCIAAIERPFVEDEHLSEDLRDRSMDQELHIVCSIFDAARI